MAGIGLFNLDFNGKSLEPVAIIAAAGVAGWFLYNHLAQNNSNQASNGQNAYLQALGLQTLFADLNGSNTNTNATSAVSGGTSSGTTSAATTAPSSATQTIAGSSAPAGTNTSAIVGASSPGSI